VRAIISLLRSISVSAWLNFRDRPHPKSIPRRGIRAGFNRRSRRTYCGTRDLSIPYRIYRLYVSVLVSNTRLLRITYGGISRSGAGRHAAALRCRCAKCVDIALCPCYDGAYRRAPARRCRAGGLHMSEPRLSIKTFSNTEQRFSTGERQSILARSCLSGPMGDSVVGTHSHTQRAVLTAVPVRKDLR
jgi:hypothetical protein